MTNLPADQLVYHVLLTHAHLKRVLNLFKQRAHRAGQFYFEVNELNEDSYQVKIFKPC